MEETVTWLLVEDDNDIRNVVAVMMSVWGEKPLPFPDCTAAWNWLDSVANGTFKGELPDLALMDIRMPGYTGDKVAARIRQTASIKDIPIVLMTAFSLTDVEIKDMMQQTGIDHLINKPLPDMDVFRSTLYRIRDERKTRVSQRTDTLPAPKPVQSTPSQVAPSATPVSTPSSTPQPTPAAAPVVPSQPSSEPQQGQATQAAQ